VPAQGRVARFGAPPALAGSPRRPISLERFVEIGIIDAMETTRESAHSLPRWTFDATQKRLSVICSCGIVVGDIHVGDGREQLKGTFDQAHAQRCPSARPTERKR